MQGEQEILRDHHIVVRDGVIARVGPGPAPAESVPAGVHRIDARGRIVMPGLINAHTHSFQTLIRGVFEDLGLIPWLQKIYGSGAVLTPEECLVSAKLGALEMIRSGVTAVCDHHFTNPTVDHPAATTEGLLAGGLRVVMARTVMDEGEIVPQSLRENPEQAFKETEELMARFKGVSSDRLRFMTGPNTPPVSASPSLCRSCREFADHHHVGISSHVAEGCGVVEMVRRDYGAGGVVEMVHRLGLTGEKSLFAHVVHLSPYEIGLLAESRTSVSHNPVSNMILGDGVSPVPAMLAAGVNVALGTDGAASNHTQDMFEVMKAASLIQRLHHQNPQAMMPKQVLRMATRGGARAIGMDDLCGEVAIGKRADLIIVDLHSHPRNVAVHNPFSHLVHVAHGTDVTHTIVNGEVLMEEGKVLTLDEPAILEDGQRTAEGFVARLDRLGI